MDDPVAHGGNLRGMADDPKLPVNQAVHDHGKALTVLCNGPLYFVGNHLTISAKNFVGQ